MDKKVIEFIGVVSGDGESFCFDVDRDTFTRIEGEEPDEYYGNSDDTFRLYPDSMFGHDNYGKKFKFKIEAEGI